MVFLNAAEEAGSVTMETAKTFTKLLAPLAPHLAEELWEALHGVIPSSPGVMVSSSNHAGRIEGFVIEQPWPTYDPAKIVKETVTIAIQVNGKVRGEITVPADTTEADVLQQAKTHENVQKYLEGKKLKKELYVKGKLVSLVL
jgi:leucyl-tRNA synthetase